jgi:hypothetical protein
MKDLLDSIGNKRKVPPALLAQVHQVRFETATSTMEMNRKLN